MILRDKEYLKKKLLHLKSWQSHLISNRDIKFPQDTYNNNNNVNYEPELIIEIVKVICFKQEGHDGPGWLT